MKNTIVTVLSLLLLAVSLNGQPTDPPYSTEKMGHVRLPVSPQRLTDNIKLPVVTHSWNVNLYYNGTDWADQEYPQLISLIADPLCIHVNKQGRGEPSITNMELQYVYNYGMGNPHARIPHELSDAIKVYPKSGTVGEPKMDFISDWGMKMSWDNGALELFSSNGCPYVFFQSNDGGITVKTDDSTNIWYEEGNALGVEVWINHFDNATQTWACFGTNNYVIYAPSGATWEKKAEAKGVYTFTSTLAGKNYASVASVPNDKEITKRIENLKYLQKYAFNFITDTKVSWKYNEEKSTITTTFKATVDSKEGAKGVPYALYPHQWLHYKGSSFNKNISYRSVRGPMKLIETDAGEFSITQRFYGILPHFPLVAGSGSGYSKAQLTSFVQEMVASGEGNNIFQGNEVYATGVTLGRTAQVVRIADQCGLTAERDTIIQWVKNSLENWLSCSEDGDNAWLVYDPNYGALIGNPPNQGMFTDKHLNDAHFQFGYMIKAAAIVATYDKKWAQDWGERIEMLIKYINNWKRDEPKFPFLRFMDPYQGHSWATGDADFRDGNNQESSSEALNCYSGIALWGMITGNKEIRDLGIYLYTTESESVNHYWWDINGICYPNGPDHGTQQNAIWEPALYHYPMSGWLWGDKVGFSTWFGSEQTGYQEYPVGINLLPMTAASLYLGRNPAYVKDNLIGWFLKKYGKVNRWNELFWEYYALADPDKALEFYKTQPHGESQPSPPSETDAHYYHWMHNLCALGPYNPAISANTPSYAVFGEYYVAFNPGAEDITATFSSGVSFKVPAGELVAYQKANNITVDKMTWKNNSCSMAFKKSGTGLQISLTLKENSHISLYSMMGRKIASFNARKGHSMHTINGVTPSAGVYLIDVHSGTNNHVRRKLILR